MECVIVLQRNDDKDRFIKFNTKDNGFILLNNIYKDTWNLIFNETSDGKFASKIFLHFISSLKLIWRFNRSTHNKNLIKTYSNFSHVFHILKKLLVHFNYWNKQENIKIFILKANTNLLISSEQIFLRVNNSYTKKK